MGSEELRGLPYLFEFWALPHQLPPEGDWKTWVIMGGRGAGKTRAALVAETYDQARDVMVHGESGILACSPEDRRPRWLADRRKLVWPNGAEAQVFSAHDYEALRGPQFDAAWIDEIGCAAVDRGTNEPNRFLDPKSSESSLPKYSTGARDDRSRPPMAGPWSRPTGCLSGPGMPGPIRSFPAMPSSGAMAATMRAGIG